MYGLNTLKGLSLGDFKNIRRDSLLAWMTAAPIMTSLFIRLALPWLTDWLFSEYAFDLTPYTDAFTGYLLVLLTPMMFGCIIGFLLLDERDDNILMALQVTPLSLKGYLLYRLSLPVLLSIVMTWLVFPVAGLAPLPFAAQLAVAFLAALEAPIYALALAALAENKVAGLALAKGASALFLLPVASYFVESKWQLLAGIVPTYWPLKLFWIVREGGSYWGYLLGGVVLHIGLLLLLLKRFDWVMHQ